MLQAAVLLLVVISRQESGGQCIVAVLPCVSGRVAVMAAWDVGCRVKVEGCKDLQVSEGE